MDRRRPTLPRPTRARRVRRVKTAALIGCVAIAVVAAGCGAGSGRVGVTSTTDVKTTAAHASATSLRQGVRAAIRANLKLSLYVLWYNEIPAWATRSTRGPALKALRAAAASRRHQGIQIKNLRGHSEILSIELAPSYTNATAEIRDTRSVAPYKAGKPLGRAIVGTDHSRVQLRRVGSTTRFIVWSVSPTR